MLEVKVATKEKDIEITAQRACHQIREMNYIDGLQERGYTDIIGYGIAFIRNLRNYAGEVKCLDL